MDEYKSKTININNDLWLEIHFNGLLRSRPYLLKIFGWDMCSEYRFSQQDLLNFADGLADFVFDNPNTTAYNDNLTGLARLWHHRRNEAIEELEKIKNG